MTQSPISGSRCCKMSAYFTTSLADGDYCTLTCYYVDMTSPFESCLIDKQIPCYPHFNLYIYQARNALTSHALLWDTCTK